MMGDSARRSDGFGPVMRAARGLRELEIDASRRSAEGEPLYPTGVGSERYRDAAKRRPTRATCAAISTASGDLIVRRGGFARLRARRLDGRVRRLLAT